MSPVPRRSIPVKVSANPLNDDGGSCVMRYVASTMMFVLRQGDVKLAECVSAKRLSDWAFEHGALVVRHEYDGKLSDNEP